MEVLDLTEAEIDLSPQAVRDLAAKHDKEALCADAEVVSCRDDGRFQDAREWELMAQVSRVTANTLRALCPRYAN